MSFADFAQQILYRNFAVVQDDRAGGRSANSHLVLFGSNGESRKSFFHEKRCEFLSVDFGENGEQIGKPCVGDPHLLAVEDVVLAV